MNVLRSAPIALVALALAACATFQNPVSRVQLTQFEAGYGVALSLAAAYRKLPLCLTGTVATPTHVCAQRSVILRLQVADRRVQGALVAARNFIVNNPTLSAISVIGAAQSALADFQAVETKYGVAR